MIKGKIPTSVLRKPLPVLRENILGVLKKTKFTKFDEVGF
jgi:hypothetical protein